MRKAFSLFLFVISAIKKIVTATAEGGGFNDENPLEGSTVILGLTFFPNIKVIFCVRKVTIISIVSGSSRVANKNGVKTWIMLPKGVLYVQKLRHA